MQTFQIGETVVVTHTVQRKVAGVWTDYNPSTSVNIVVYDPSGAVSVSSTSMTNDATGEYHYDFQSSGKTAGVWKARITDTDGARITIKDGTFRLEN